MQSTYPRRDNVLQFFFQDVLLATFSKEAEV